MSSDQTTETQTPTATGPFSPIGEVLLAIQARIAELNLPMPAIDGRLLIFSSRAAAIMCAGYGVFAVDPDPEYWDLSDTVEGCDAYAYVVHQFTICWPVTS